MPFISNPGFLAAAFIEASAAFILLVLYSLLAPGFPARFFRLWMAGWTLYVGLGALQIFSLWRGGPYDLHSAHAISLLAAGLFFAATLECRGQGRRTGWLRPLAAVSLSGFLTLALRAFDPGLAQWP